MEQSKILTKARRELLSKYPVYSQDGKRGDAVAVLRLFITGTSATFYILEGEPAGEYDGRENWELFGVSNMEADGWSYGYYSLAEMEGISLYGGLVHLEADEHYKPTRLRDIAEVVPDLSPIWKQGEEMDAQGDDEQDDEQDEQ